MADPFPLFRQRLEDNLCKGRGTSAPFSAAAQQRAIAAGRIRYSEIPLDDPAIGESPVDRSLHLRWSGIGGDFFGAGPNESQFDYRELKIGLELCVGYEQSAPTANLVHLVSGESAAALVREPRIRAFRDALLIGRALSFPELIQGDLGGGNKILRIIQRSDTRFESIGGGRLIHVQPFELHTYITNTQ